MKEEVRRLLSMAEAEPKKDCGDRVVYSSDLVDVIDALRARGFTWAEVVEWLTARGMVRSYQSLCTAYKRAKRAPQEPQS